jgi:hypothetical protein
MSRLTFRVHSHADARAPMETFRLFGTRFGASSVNVELSVTAMKHT